MVLTELGHGECVVLTEPGHGECDTDRIRAWCMWH